jgi:hypothetical protein
MALIALLTALPWMALPNSTAGYPRTMYKAADIARARELRRCYTWFLDAVFPDGTLPAANDSHVGERIPLSWSEIATIRYRDPKALRHLKEAWGDALEGGTLYSLFYRDPDMGVEGPGTPYAVESVHLPGKGMMILRDAEPSAEGGARVTASPRTMAIPGTRSAAGAPGPWPITRFWKSRHRKPPADRCSGASHRG